MSSPVGNCHQRRRAIGTIPIAVFLGLYSLRATVLAGFDEDMETIARRMAASLRLSPVSELSVTTIPEDKSYMLSLAPVYRVLKRKLSPYARSVRFNTFRGPETATIRSMILSGGSEYAPLSLTERHVDSLVMTGSYHLIPGQTDFVNITLSLMNTRGLSVFESDEYTISKADSPPATRREIFAQLADRETLGRMSYKGSLIRKLDRLFHVSNNNLLAAPAEYRLVQRDPYAVGWQVEMLSELLTIKYGICLAPGAEDAISVDPGGGLTFSRHGKRRHLQDVLDTEPLLPDSFPRGVDSLHYITRSHTSTPRLERKAYQSSGERRIAEAIRETFDTHYPRLFNTLDLPRLRHIFADQSHPSVLVGRKLSADASTGRELVAYRWYTASQWLDQLQEAHELRGRRFDVRTSVMGVFNDASDPQRYWAMVRQNWNTRDRHGAVVYKDDGFLVVAFDFDAAARLKQFRIHYRLWFCNYQYDDVELGMRRHEKLLADIDRYFVNDLGGIDLGLKRHMRDFLARKVQTVAIGTSIREPMSFSDRKEVHPYHAKE